MILTENLDYFERLKWSVDAEGYDNMVRILYETPFWSENKLDQNLIENVLDYRWGHGYVGTGEVSVFEVFCVLAMDAERKIMHNSGAGNRTPEWFWCIMRNLGLDIYTDEDWRRRFEGEITAILDDFLNRRYGMKGENGPFPIKSGGKDCRKADLWRQMNWFLGENFRYEFGLEVI